ncbi:MAG: AAA family ATPase [Pseudomonadota bacterium]
MNVVWPPEAALVVDDRVVIGAAPQGWRPVADVPLVVLVGLTGVGKTTLSAALAAAGRVTILPDRRRLTDDVILKDAGNSLDRSARFTATARFRKAAPGGMGDILATMSVAPPDRVLLFDGLRGAAEVASFAAQSEKTLFLALVASNTERARRIASRGDDFDGAASGSEARARDLVEREAGHYSQEDTLAALAEHAESRTIVIDAERLSAAGALAEAEAALTAAFA